MADLAEILAEYAEPLTLALIVAAATVFVLMALRSRSLKSLQVQFSIGMVVWAASEIPHIMGSIGLIDIEESYQDLGLWFHFVSMFILAAFVAIRTPRILGGVKTLEAIENAAFKGLMSVLGESGARAATFYLELSKARNRPREFVMNLRKVFAAGSVTMERRIAEALAASGLADPADVSSGRDLSDMLVKARLMDQPAARPA